MGLGIKVFTIIAFGKVFFFEIFGLLIGHVLGSW
jgi:hypothetical protein